MKVPFVDLKAQYKTIKHEVLPAIENILDNAAYVLGKAVFDFEKTFALVHNLKYCVALSAGTDGNHVALWALGIGHGDEVIIPANTFIATVWGVTLCGAKPVFVDCESKSHNIDPSRVEASITEKTKAIVAVHLYGQPADMDPLIEIAKRYNIYLVEDASQSHLAEYKGKKVGGIADASSFSFYPGKNLGAYGEGGAVTTNNKVLATKFQMIRDHGSKEKYHHEMYGHNYRMSGIQGAVLSIKINYLEDWTKKRRVVAVKYNNLLKDIYQIETPVEMDYAKHVYHLYVIKVIDGSRDELQKYLGKNEIASGLHYPIPLHLQSCFSRLNYKKGDFPNAESIAENGLSLPMFPELTDKQINMVSNKIHDFFI